MAQASCHIGLLKVSICKLTAMQYLACDVCVIVNDSSGSRHIWDSDMLVYISSGVSETLRKMEVLAAL